jgi:hypothetical protein
MGVTEFSQAITPAFPLLTENEEIPIYDHAEAIIYVVQRRNPLRAAYAMVISFLDVKGRVLKTIRKQSEIYHGLSSHEVTLHGVLFAFSLVDPELPLTIKCNHRRADDQLHGLADMEDRGWRCRGGTRSKHLNLLQEIFELKSSRANVEFVTPRVRKTGSYSVAKSLGEAVLDGNCV